MLLDNYLVSSSNIYLKTESSAMHLNATFSVKKKKKKCSLAELCTVGDINFGHNEDALAYV